ncbi:thioredoxin fold domain-containing protein [Caminibacter pacificus]|uniref:Thiol:disulfide interchange protein n=1 Tax=Caminibacter pacificus TaxID=1424653 RepID=A0AAJ4RBE6_9BACT|nr:thioredoxin fold domain-containing protein [Caminibacter pacificus]QCI27443.1 thiol:disulfide interchange protein [Caminibacter pacificus]ROR38880.1 thiol:disulfide interchange protein DsbC [Caminibacter pacificus]
MKKILIGISAAVMLFASQNTQKEAMEALKASPLYNQIIKAKKEGLPIKAQKIDGLYVYRLTTPRGVIYIYLTADKKYTFIGNAIDNKTKKPIQIAKNANIINKGVMFTFGKGKKEIYLVTDPECPFCRKMEAMKKDILEKNYKVHVILLPLPFHKYARPMSYYILAGKTDAQRAKRMKEVLSGSDAWKKFKPTKEQIKKFEEELKNAQIAAEELDARGTPSVFDKNFNPIPWPTLGDKK